MGLSRRDLLAASALVIAPSTAVLGQTPQRAAQTSATPLTPTPPTSAQLSKEPVVLCWNENPYGPGPAARAALQQAIPGSCRYPDAAIDQLRQTLARREGASLENIVIGTGSGELLCALGLLHGRNGGEIIAAQPTYAELTEYARRSGATLKPVPVDARLRHDLAGMRAAVSERTRAVYLCNPNNPTGTALPARDVRAFIASLPRNVTTIVDEAYLDFVEGDDIGSAVDLVRAGSRVVVLRTFSKIHGMAGVRCGYAIAPTELATELNAARMTTASVQAMEAAQASLGDKAFLEETRRRILASRARIVTELTRLKLRYAEPQGNFVFFDTGMPLARFTELMRARNILVGRLFPPFDTWCRITVGTEAEVQAFLTALQGVVTGAQAAA